MEYRRVRMSRAERVDWVARLEASGRSVLSFAKAHDLSAHSLGRWRREACGVSPKMREVAAVDFQTVSLPGSESAAWAAEVDLASGTRVRLRAGVPGGWVRELVEALR